MTPDQYYALLRAAFDKYLLRLDAEPSDPADPLLGYDFSFLDGRRWHLLAQEMISCDLRELTNLLNHWLTSLQRWHVWNNVIREHDENVVWDLQREFLEALSHECLLRPSALRDTFTSVATSAFHQVRLSYGDSAYKDWLPDDPVRPGQRPVYLSRRAREASLEKIASVWEEAKPFMQQLRKLDALEYRECTFDYRNLQSHTIGPRLGFGHTRTVRRHVEQARKLEKNADGTYGDVLVPVKMAVAYGFGGTPSLDLVEARVWNLDQFKLSRACYSSFLALLQKATTGIAESSIAR